MRQFDPFDMVFITRHVVLNLHRKADYEHSDDEWVRVEEFIRIFDVFDLYHFTELLYKFKHRVLVHRREELFNHFKLVLNKIRVLC